jgi:hypothetical protein
MDGRVPTCTTPETDDARGATSMRATVILMLTILCVPVAARATPDGAWEELRPLQRTAHAAFHDPTRDRMILVGGVIENYQGDPTYDGATNGVWVVDLAVPTGWTRLTPSGAAPTPRVAPAVIFDAARNRLVWVGGAGASMGDVWTLTLTGSPSWSQHAAAGPLPPARSHAAVAYDPVRDQLVMTGGEDVAGNPLGDVWTMSMSAGFTWAPIAPAGTAPSARTRAAFRYDPPRDQFVMVGGTSAVLPEYRADVWTLELSGTPSWSQLAVSGGPPDARAAATIVYAPQTDRFIMFGGGRGFVYLNDLWQLDLSGAPAWTNLGASGGPPSVRDAHSAVYDVLRNHMIVYGGTTFYGVDEGWKLDLSGAPAWSLLPMPYVRPDARRGATVIVDVLNQRLVCFGGGAPNNQTWVLPLAGPPQWSLLTTGGTPPAARRYHHAVLDPVRRRMIVFGGTAAGATGQLKDVWALPLDGPPNWVQLFPSGSSPAGRSDAAAIYDPNGDRLVIFGGSAGTSDLSDVWTMSLGASPAWTKLSPGGSLPSARSAMACAYDPVYARLIIYGGFSQGGLQSEGDTYALRMTGAPVWRKIYASGTGPSARSSVATAIDTRRGRMLVFGGTGDFGVTTRTNQVWSMTFTDSAWTQLAPQGFLPSIRGGAIAAYDSLADRMIAYGGFTGVDFSEINWALTFIEQTVSVPGPRGTGPAFALYGAVPNPSRGDFGVSFRLPDASPARIDVFDIAGRRVRTAEVGAMGAGMHQLSLGAPGRLATGVYMVRLSRGGEHRVARAVVLD